eukprot:jgi/Ulvmu1/2210/UM013_0056.1
MPAPELPAKQIGTWGPEFRAQCRALHLSHTDVGPALDAAASSMLQLLPNLGELSEADRSGFVAAVQGVRNAAALANTAIPCPLVPQLASSLIEHAARLTLVSQESADNAQSMLRAAAQLLANLASGPATAAAAWQACWPDAVLKLSMTRVPRALEAACQALLNWSRADAQAAEHVCGGCPRLVVQLLRGSLQVQDEAANAVLALLLSHLALSRGNLALLLDTIAAAAAAERQLEPADGGSRDRDPPTNGDASQHAARHAAATECHESMTLLHLLAHEVAVSPSVLFGGQDGGAGSASSGAAPDDMHAPDGMHAQPQQLPAVMQCLAAVVIAACDAYADAACCVRPDPAGTPLASTAAHVLEASLRVLATALSRDEAQTCAVDAKAALLQDGRLVPVLLGLLAALPPLTRPPAASQAPADPLPEQPRRMPPYPEARADVLSVLGNLVHRHSAAQAAVAAGGGAELLLAQCQFAPEEPLVREWALWAVRNLCEGSEEVRHQLAALQPAASVQDEALRARQQAVEMDHLTGKLKLVDLDQ